LRAGAQCLYRVHDIGLLREESVAQIFGPGQLVAHHVEHLRRRNQSFYAVIPLLFLNRVFQRFAFEIFVRGDPAARLHDFQRIGRRHHHLGQQIVRIERNRRDQLLELLRLEQLIGRSLCRRWSAGSTRGRRLRCGWLILCKRNGRRQRGASDCGDE